MRIENKQPSEIEKMISPYLRKRKGAINAAALMPGVSNSGRPTTGWMRKVTEKVKISDLARQHGINVCPRCNYVLYFDDSRGWFCCAKKKWRNDCTFNGNIVDFVEFIGGEI